MPRPTELTVAQLANCAALELGVSDWFVIDQPRVDLFAEATDDHQWIHVDSTRAAGGPFGTTIAHGYLTLSLVPRLLTGLLRISDAIRGTNYGLDRVRFTDPVQVGSSVRLAARLLESSVRQDQGVQYKVAVRIEVEGKARPALIAESILLAYAS